MAKTVGDMFPGQSSSSSSGPSSSFPGLFNEQPKGYFEIPTGFSKPKSNAPKTKPPQKAKKAHNYPKKHLNRKPQEEQTKVNQQIIF